MNCKFVAAVFAGLAIGASAFAVAGEPERNMGQRGMHGNEMHGMACGMMGSGMMAGNMMRGGMMPQLPPGNEKLQVQMQADIMQKMGEIVAKYAAQARQVP